MKRNALKHEPDLSLFPERWNQGAATCVSTHALYPNGENVVIDVLPGIGERWTVTDGGRGYELLRERMVEWLPRAASRRAKAVSDSTSVNYEGGTWSTPKVSALQLPAAIMWTANASQMWVGRMLQDSHSGASEALEALLKDKLKFVFGEANVEEEAKLFGNSTREYTFTALAHIGGGRQAAFEFVTPFGNSLNAAYTKMDDVRARGSSTLRVEAVIADEINWKARDIALLRSVANSVIPLDDRLLPRLRSIA